MLYACSGHKEVCQSVRLCEATRIDCLHMMLAWKCKRNIVCVTQCCMAVNTHLHPMDDALPRMSTTR